jgi:hypothetical protein
MKAVQDAKIKQAHASVQEDTSAPKNHIQHTQTSASGSEFVPLSGSSQSESVSVADVNDQPPDDDDDELPRLNRLDRINLVRRGFRRLRKKYLFKNLFSLL